MIAVGPGKVNDKGEKINLDVKAGDKVLFGKYAGNEIRIDGDDWTLDSWAQTEHLAAIGSLPNWEGRSAE